jgi:8-oxo-dGTP pyrophosphatase MutT (NUDIX family)
VFRDGDRLLGFEVNDSTKEVVGFRSLGGGIEDGETSLAAVIREVDEELGVAIEDLRLLGVLENLFVYEGRPGHEIVFVYEARFADPADYERELFEIREPNLETYPAVWKRMDDFRSGRLALYPPDLLELLDRAQARLP